VTDALRSLICESGINHNVFLATFSNVRFLDMCSLKVMIDNAFLWCFKQYNITNDLLVVRHTTVPSDHTGHPLSLTRIDMDTYF